MILHQKSKSAKNEIPLDAAKALDPESFATYTNQTGGGAPVHVALGWTLHSIQQPEEGKKRAKYQDNVFELRMAPEHIDKLIEALKTAKKRFKTAAIPEQA